MEIAGKLEGTVPEYLSINIVAPLCSLNQDSTTDLDNDKNEDVNQTVVAVTQKVDDYIVTPPYPQARVGRSYSTTFILHSPVY